MLTMVTGFAIVFAVLLVSGLLPTTTRTYALRVPNFVPAVSLTPGHDACESPITSDGAARGVEIFGEVGLGDPRVVIDARALSGRVIASGLIRHPAASSQQDVRLNRSVPGGVPVRVCIRTLNGTYRLKGAGRTNPLIHTTGTADGAQFSLLLTRQQTPISSLPTAFRRASIFRPDWIGPWWFWLLLGLLVAAFVLAAIGVSSASKADRRETPRN